MTKCSNPDCHAPDVGCCLGITELSQCSHWDNIVRDENEIKVNSDTEIYLPWTGSVFGLNDVGFLSGSSKPKVVGIIGAENAGKTSLLATWYLMVSRGLPSSFQSQFAGSYSLTGWESVSDHLRWEPGHFPCFPPHTPSGNRRLPGLLHMAFKNKKNNIIQDYLFADAPGEWFGKWAVNLEASEAEGARWLASNADIFLLIADREALSGKRKGRTRSEVKRLIQRLGGVLQNRPIALVWSKSDIPKDEIVEDSIRSQVLSVMPEITEFETQLFADKEGDSSLDENILKLLNWILEQELGKGKLPKFEYKGNDPLFMFGRGF